MRKNVKNDKVIRAITIGLATMIATSGAPVSVFAAEGEGEAANPPGAAPETTTQSAAAEETSASETVVEADNSAVVEEAKDLSDMVSNDVAPVVGAIDQAAVEVVPMTDLLSEEGAAAIDADLMAAADLIDKDATEADALGNLASAQDNVSQAIVIANAADDLVDAGNAALDKADEDGKNFADRMEDFDTAAGDASGHADEAINQAEIANKTAQSQGEAVEAKEKAKEELDTAEEGLFVAVNEYNAAQEAVINAQSELEEAMEKQRLAQEKLEAARADLSKAGMDANAANEKMKAAQAKLQQIKKDEEKLEQNAQKMEAIEKQTYAMMVQYFRDAGAAVYNEDGSLNIEASANKMSQEQIDSKAKSASSNVMILGRDLLQKILDYKLSNDPNVDWSTLEIGKEERDAKGRLQTVHKEAREGTVFESGDLVNKKDKDSKGQDQVVISTDRSSRGRNDKNLKAKEDTGVNWFNSTQGDSGRTNRVKVTYKDKDGNEHTEYYNYVFKQSKLDGETDIANSPVFVAQINETSSGWVVSEDPNVDLDDYGTVKQKVAEAKATIKEYNEAVSAVDEAQKKVDELEKKIKGLSDIVSKTGLDGSRIQALQDRLDEANEELDAAKEKKEALEDKVAEAKKAYESIDLSRFDVQPSGSGAADEAADEAGGGETAETPDEAPAAAPVFTAPSAVLPTGGAAPAITPSVSASIDEAIREAIDGASGAAGGAAAVEAAGGAVFAEAAGQAAAGEEIVVSQNGGSIETDMIDEGENLVRLEDGAVPLAEMSNLMGEDSVELNWWWSLIITLFGAAGKAMYDRNRKRKEARVKADR